MSSMFPFSDLVQVMLGSNFKPFLFSMHHSLATLSSNYHRTLCSSICMLIPDIQCHFSYEHFSCNIYPSGWRHLILFTIFTSLSLKSSLLLIMHFCLISEKKCLLHRRTWLAYLHKCFEKSRLNIKEVILGWV